MNLRKAKTLPNRSAPHEQAIQAQVEDLANSLGISPEELKERALEAYPERSEK